MSKYFVFIMTLFVTALCLDAAGGELAVTMEWQLADGKAGRKDFPAVDISNVSGRGLWLAFEKKNDKSYPGICVDGKFARAAVPIEEMTALELVVTADGRKQSATRRSVIFSKTRPFGSKMATPENVYHLLVLDGSVGPEDLPESLDSGEAPLAEWEAPFWRTHRLAMNYAVQSDAKTREYKNVFNVKTRHSFPRLILVAEEWLDIPKEVLVKKKSSSPWGALDDLADEIGGEKKLVPTKIPIYSVDVLLDGLEAKGKYLTGFNASRSIWNDILEGKIIYEAAEGKRGVLTATIVFSQMRKNMAARNSGNGTMKVDARNARLLDKCEELWPAVKDDIAAFLDENPDWNIIIPRKPVIFYNNDEEPIYAMYAWFQVHPETGRMVGVLPNGTRGGMSNELPKATETLMKKARDRIVAEAGGGAVKGFFSQIAGMYVSAGGIIEAITLTFCDPSIAALSGEDWQKFVAMHALDYCQKFLEANADQYDSYAAQLGFWQGAMVLIGEFGGKDAMRRCANNAIDGVKNKAESDARNYVDDKVKEGEKVSKEILDEAMETYAPGVKEFVDGVNTVKEHYDQGAELGTTAGEVINEVRDALD